ncbi:hypothetical protein A7U60_g8555 [Sanghuangporus baumii]|uniref:Uncharacterized protein n=1 Tax=Sanghuangporus baumii TaxID=108892 RepID=A0A9Q5HRK2_SANBA|nr:hypothetical protein A7U60_g8555 [Sanghuangporus baumii]
MSSINTGFNQSSTTGGNEGSRDSRGGVGSYGQGTGSGAYDTSNTDQGGYGGQKQQRGSDDQTSRTSDNFNESPQFGQSQHSDQSQTQGSDRRAFGGDRGAEKPGFSGSDSAYNKTTTGGAFGQRDDFNKDSTNTSGTRSSGAASGGGFSNTTDDARDRGQFGSQSQTSDRKDQSGGDSEREHQGGKPTFGEKMRGNVEKLAGSVTGRTDLKERGQERKTGEF